MARTEYIPRGVLESLLHTMKNTEDVDVLKETAHWLIQELIELDVSDEIGADRYQRSDERRTYRNGSRQCTLNTRLGDLEISIPKLREGSAYPEWLLERGRPAERALLGVVMEAYVNGISTRKMERMVRELGLEGMDKSQVSRINRGLDGRVKAFLERPLEGSMLPFPRFGKTARFKVLPWSLPWPSTRRVIGRSWAYPSVLQRPRSFGRTSCESYWIGD